MPYDAEAGESPLFEKKYDGGIALPQQNNIIDDVTCREECGVGMDDIGVEDGISPDGVLLVQLVAPKFRDGIMKTT